MVVLKGNNNQKYRYIERGGELGEKSQSAGSIPQPNSERRDTGDHFLAEWFSD